MRLFLLGTKNITMFLGPQRRSLRKQTMLRKLSLLTTKVSMFDSRVLICKTRSNQGAGESKRTRDRGRKIKKSMLRTRKTTTSHAAESNTVTTSLSRTSATQNCRINLDTNKRTRQEGTIKTQKRPKTLRRDKIAPAGTTVQTSMFRKNPSTKMVENQPRKALRMQVATINRKKEAPLRM